MSRELPVFSILEQPPYFLRLKLEHRTYEKQAQYRVVLEGDAQTKEMAGWSSSYTDTLGSFSEEKARYA